uniref:C-type lectin domain-containing protein n=1 Tax=Leptobrachium leishanense TaxID=445787 RepID=A0A8C5PZK2_9ANUR
MYNCFLSAGRCAHGWHPYKTSCYNISKVNKNWDNANHACQSLYPGAHLVNVHSKEEQQFLSSYLHKLNDVILLWSGLSDKRVWSLLMTIFLNYTDWYTPLGTCQFFTYALLSPIWLLVSCILIFEGNSRTYLDWIDHGCPNSVPQMSLNYNSHASPSI